ncbi:heat repeat-containing protein [Nitzschia inconspicua]|uniref:Heat repeat-containing protein n=1 Tax=Nitzschia inconspicua TaxID=303405 RepID=A0A9K3LV33_9STRA|nr:heat repeat-containing protein [Nitzschia inconspicua]
MDFSSPTRALQSLPRRNPALPDDILHAAQVLLDSSNEETKTSDQAYLDAITSLVQLDEERWEGLAVGLLLATDILIEASAAQHKAKAVYIDGPRVPDATISGSDIAVTSRSYTTTQVSEIATLLYNATLKHLEHNEPRIRTFVAKAVGAHATWSIGFTAAGVADPEMMQLHETERNEIYQTIITSINEHIQQGRDNSEKYSKSSTGALDDTTGWRALETNWQCVACWIASLGSAYFEKLQENDMETLLSNLEYSAVTHVNRHVRAAAIAVMEQLVIAAGSDSKYWPYLENGELRTTTIKILKAGLADNWSQVRMAASVLNRVFWSTLQETCHFPTENLQLLYPVLVPRMCLNRFYLAQGVKLYSHQTWKLVFPENGVEVVAQSIASIVRYYVQMCDADNHVVREAACQAVAELAVKIGMDEQHAAVLQPHVAILLQALLMCFHDESWPVRDEACLACGTFCRAYPEECRSELETLWTRWTEQLTDQIWSVRADAAVALGQACQAYGQEFFDRLMKFIKETLPSAKNQPSMSMEEYKALQNNMDAHTDSQLYSCGSLAPKLKKKAGAGRIGCSNCGITRPKQPWEATDGCLYLIRELMDTCSEPDSVIPPLSDELLLPLLQEVADVCRVSHFPQGDELRATLWRQLPGMMNAVGKVRCKRLYLEVFLDLLIRNLESSSASAISKHAAATCAYELGVLIGPNILRGRLFDERQQEVLDRALREREIEERNMAPMLQHQQNQKQFSPFEPPGLLDTPYSQKMQPGLPPELLIQQHPPQTYGGNNRPDGLGDAMSM